MWRDVALIRTHRRASCARSACRIRRTTCGRRWRKHAAIAAEIVALFHARFDPRLEHSSAQRRREADEIAARDRRRRSRAVESLDEDRILRHFLNAVQSALRTNFYQLDADGQPKPQIAIKFDSRKLDGLPLPKPLYEIFVYSPRVEGVHLRFGKVARGGIRWSDRPQDFRTEVLGLVKAQQVKNAVIVPVGAKGGFVPKHAAERRQRDAVQAEGTATYKLFISTPARHHRQHRRRRQIVPPQNVVRHDDDDPYLVVAADKGTATFSDIANAHLARARLLARRCLRLRRLGRLRPQGDGHHRARRLGIGQAPFPRDGCRHPADAVHRRRASATCRATCSATACCASSTIRLRAAFDHRDIFIDPDPDPEASFAERAAAVRAAALELAGLRQDADLARAAASISRTARKSRCRAEAQKLLGLARRRSRRSR